MTYRGDTCLGTSGFFASIGGKRREEPRASPAKKRAAQPGKVIPDPRAAQLEANVSLDPSRQLALPGCAAPLYVSLASDRFVAKQQSLRYPRKLVLRAPRCSALVAIRYAITLQHAALTRAFCAMRAMLRCCRPPPHGHCHVRS